MKNPPVPFLKSEEGDTRSMADGYPAWRYVCQLRELAYHLDLVCGFDECYVDHLTDAKGDIVWIEVDGCTFYLTGGQEMWCREFGKVSNHCYLPEHYIYRYDPGKDDLIRFESHHLDRPRPHANGRNGEHVFPEDGLDIIGLNLYIAIMICSEYVSSARYPLDRKHFGHYNKVISDAKRRLLYGKCAVASDAVPARRR